MTTLCLLCGDFAASDTDTQFSSNSTKKIFLKWADNCANSFCKLFELEDDKMEKIYKRGKYCLKCLNILRDVDFTLRAIDNLQNQLKNSRRLIQYLLNLNYNTTVKRSNASAEYLKMLETFYKCVQPFKSQNTIRVTRTKADDLQHSDNHSGKDVEVEEFDISKGLEVILKDEGESSETENQREGSYDNFVGGPEEIQSSDSDTDDNASDEDWNSSRKKSIPKGSSRPKPKIRKQGQGDGDDRRVVIWVKPKKEKSETKVREIKRLHCAEEGCNFTCAAQFKMDAHVNKVHKDDSTPFHCTKCDQKFGSSTGYYYHRTKHNDKEMGSGTGTESIKNFPCDICGRNFSAKWIRTKHMAIIHPHGDVMRCTYCRKIFTESAELTPHEELHKAKLNTDPFGCVLCDAGFTHTQDLKAHVLWEHEPTLAGNKCTPCNKVFETQKNLKRHIIVMHKDRNPDWKCPQCEFIGTCKSSLANHVATHESLRNFICDHCGQEYKMKSTLNYHLRAAHSDQGKYKCHICDKTFHSTNSRQAHEESHNKVKTYVCDNCGKAFMAKKNLIQHKRSHSEIKVRYGKKWRKDKTDKDLVSSAASSRNTNRNKKDQDLTDSEDSYSLPNPGSRNRIPESSFVQQQSQPIHDFRQSYGNLPCNNNLPSSSSLRQHNQFPPPPDFLFQYGTTMDLSQNSAFFHHNRSQYPLQHKNNSQ